MKRVLFFSFDYYCKYICIVNLNGNQIEQLIMITIEIMIVDGGERKRKTIIMIMIIIQLHVKKAIMKRQTNL